MRASPSWTFRVLALLLSVPAVSEGTQAAAPEAVLISARRIWDAAPHNAFTDLARFGGWWFCVFREGAGHVSPDGAIRVLRSRDGEHWESAARLTSGRGDLRDPKVVEAPGGRLMLTAAVALAPNAGGVRHQGLAWFSSDGLAWGEPVEIGEPNLWLWRVTWAGETALGIGYGTAEDRFVRLYQSDDGRRFETWVDRLRDEGYPNESSIVFAPDRTAYCLLRRDGTPNTGLVGVSRPPYREWAWKDLGVRLGGPHWLRLGDGRWVAAVRLYDAPVRTALAWVDVEKGRLTEFLRLPSGGDTSYAGMQWHEGQLWVSYYASHEGKSAIYLAKVRLGE